MSDTLAADAASSSLAALGRPVPRTRLRPSVLVRRLLLIAAPVLAGLFAILGTAFDPAAGLTGRDMWALYAENPDPLQWKSFGLHWSYTFWALPALGAWGFIRARGAWLANIAGLLGIVGVAMLPGMLIVDFRSGWSDRHGVHKLPIDKAAIDLVCIYCPETDQCYYLDPTQHRLSVTLRLTPTRNNQVAGVLNAADYRKMPGG